MRAGEETARVGKSFMDARSCLFTECKNVSIVHFKMGGKKTKLLIPGFANVGALNSSFICSPQYDTPDDP